MSLDNLVLKFLWKYEGPKLTKTKLSSKWKDKSERFTLLGRKTYCKSLMIETMWYWIRIKEQIDQWNKAKVWNRPTYIWILLNDKIDSKKQ